MRIKSNILRLYHWQSSGKYFPVLLITFAFVIRLGLIVTTETYSSPYHFSEHVQIANNILTGKGYSHDWYGLGAAGEGSFMPPAYVGVVLVAKMVFISMPWLATQIFQASLSACTAILIYFIGREVFSELVGIISSLGVAVYPPILGYVLDIQSTSLETFLVAFTVFVGIYWRKYGIWKYAFVWGSALGLAVLTRSSLILVLPLLFVWMVLSHRRRGVIHFIVVVGVFILALGPWVLRNYLVYERFVLVSTNGGFTMFQGNNVNATGVAYPSLGEVWKQYPELAKELAPIDEAARDGRLYQESIAFIQTHTREACSLALKKFVYFWWFKPRFIEAGIMSGYPWYFGFIYMGSYLVLLVLSILGLVLSFRRFNELLIFYAFFLTQTLVSMVFIAGTRFRTILEPLLVVFAAYGIVQICNYINIKCFARNEIH